MKKSIIALLLVFSLSSCAELMKALETADGLAGITQSEAASGLKEALVNGVSNGTSFLGKEGGFLKNAAYKILMPQEIQGAITQIKERPMIYAVVSPYLDKVVTAMNSGAEKAMAEAKPIFVSAIKSMTITDAINIVTGGNGSGTSYLKKATSTALKSKFTPVIKSSLDKVNINDPWTKVTTAYNQVLGKKVQTDLNEYVTDKAMVALFSKINDEENNIRANPGARVTPILKKVFDYADQNK